jgi:hypothetical protein
MWKVPTTTLFLKKNYHSGTNADDKEKIYLYNRMLN